jgi:hypothetical protein
VPPILYRDKDSSSQLCLSPVYANLLQYVQRSQNKTVHPYIHGQKYSLMTDAVKVILS